MICSVTSQHGMREPFLFLRQARSMFSNFIAFSEVKNQIRGTHDSTVYNYGLVKRKWQGIKRNSRRRMGDIRFYFITKRNFLLT